MPITWHLVTGEYPPGCGGVGDYTAAVAAALADAGDDVHVWTPSGQASSRGAVTVHLLRDRFGGAARRQLLGAWRAAPGVVLLQYVPNALGRRGANLPFCTWFAGLRRQLPDVRVMFHEPYFYFRPSRPFALSNALALVQRLMARALLDGATQVYYSTDTWRRYLQPRRGEAATLSIPSTIPCAAADAAIAHARLAATGGRDDALVVGHFGTYGAHVAGELRAVLPALAERVPQVRFALLGDGGRDFAAALPGIEARSWTPGRMEGTEVAAALRACDVVVQPYPDGITTRRTSAMAALCNGTAMVTTAGALTETIWTARRAAMLVPAGDPRAVVEAIVTLLQDPAARAALGRDARDLYTSMFSLEHTVAVLRSAAVS